MGFHKDEQGNWIPGEFKRRVQLTEEERQRRETERAARFAVEKAQIEFFSLRALLGEKLDENSIPRFPAKLEIDPYWILDDEDAPPELWTLCDGCTCVYCSKDGRKSNPEAAWDTLAISTNDRDQHTWTVHTPEYHGKHKKRQG